MKYTKELVVLLHHAAYIHHTEGITNRAKFHIIV